MRPWQQTRMVDWLISPEQTGEMLVLYQGPKARRGYPDDQKTREGLYFARLSGKFYRTKGFLITEVPIEDVMEMIDAESPRD